MWNQDYHDQTIVIRNKNVSKDKKTEIKKNTYAPNSSNINSAKIERDFEKGKSLKIWGSLYGRKVAQARSTLNPKLNQQQLANKLKVRLDIVKEIENGKGLYNAKISNDIFKILKIKNN